MKRWAQWAIGAGLLVAAWGVAAVTPAEDSREAPFVVAAAVGEFGEGRNIAVRVTDVVRAESVTAEGWNAEGNWLVVHLDAAGVVEEDGARLGSAMLDVGGATYSASERPASLRGSSLPVGAARSGSIAFELPEDLAAGDAVLRFALVDDIRLDSVVEVPLDLGEVPFEQSAELRETGWSAR